LLLEVSPLSSWLEFCAAEKELSNVRTMDQTYCTIHNITAVLCNEKAKLNLQHGLLELDSSSAMEATTTFIITKSPIPAASNESLDSAANVEEKSQHQQDNSSENTEISSLPKYNK